MGLCHVIVHSFNFFSILNFYILKCSDGESSAYFCQKSGNTVLGLPYALASLSFCQSFNLDLLKASAALMLAELWLSLGSNHTKRALSLIHGALPMILGHGGLELCARARIAEAKCYLSDRSYSGSTLFFFVLFLYDIFFHPNENQNTVRINMFFLRGERS